MSMIRASGRAIVRTSQLCRHYSLTPALFNKKEEEEKGIPFNKLLEAFNKRNDKLMKEYREYLHTSKEKKDRKEEKGIPFNKLLEAFKKEIKEVKKDYDRLEKELEDLHTSKEKRNRIQEHNKKEWERIKNIWDNWPEKVSEQAKKESEEDKKTQSAPNDVDSDKNEEDKKDKNTFSGSDDRNSNDKNKKGPDREMGIFEWVKNMVEEDVKRSVEREKKEEEMKRSGMTDEEVKEKRKELRKKDEEEFIKKQNEKMEETMERMMGMRMGMKFEWVMPGAEGSKRFKDVGGHLEAKVELMEIVDFLKNPEKYQRLGAKVPSGALLTGPPGNGKTLLAKSIAGESEVPFIATAGPQFIEKIGGLGAKRMRELFAEARSKAPCIMFIDELDAIGSRNDAGFQMQGAGGGMDEADQVINQMLVELDGMSTKPGEVFVIGATNRDQKVDKALKRAGRLERKIYIDLPTLSEREEIFRLNMLAIKSDFDHAAQATRLALLTPRYSGADIANIVNEAAIEAARLGQSAVSAGNFEYAIERVIAGLERRSHSVSKEETRVSAYYEASQALLGWVLPKGDKVLKMSIKPRVQNEMGFRQLEPQLDYLHSKERLLDMVCQALAGRAGEAIFFSRLTNRAESDLKNAQNVCNNMVTLYGMGECAANLSFPPGPNPKIKPYSNALQREMDAEIQGMVSTAYKKSFAIVSKHREEVQVLAEALIEKQVLNEDDIALILKDVPTTRASKFTKTVGR